MASIDHQDGAPVDLVVVGQGYVGLPLAQAAVAKGLTVVGLDRSQRVVDALNSGSSHIDDISDAELATMVDQGYSASTDASVQARAKAIVICVPTPLSDADGPDLTAVTSAAASAAEHLRPGTLVVLESTTYPGTTEEVVRPILERGGLTAGTDFHLAFSPSGSTRATRCTGSSTRPRSSAGSLPNAPRSPRSCTAGSSTASCRPRAHARPRWPSCWRTPTGT
ncbi:hypothetical protein GCM10029992_04180 [Glycomyces albus]